MRLDLLRVVERHQMLSIGVASSVFLSGLMAAPVRFAAPGARSTGCDQYRGVGRPRGFR